MITIFRILIFVCIAYTVAFQGLTVEHDAGFPITEVSSVSGSTLELHRADIKVFTPRLLPQEGHADAIIEIQCSADGSKAVSASQDGKVSIWNIATGEKINSFSRIATRAVSSNAVFVSDEAASSGVVSTSDSDVIATVSEEDIVFWDIISGDVFRSFHLPPKEISEGNNFFLSISPDNKILVVEIIGGGYSRVISWDIYNGQLCQDIKTERIYDIDFTNSIFSTSGNLNIPLLSTNKNMTSTIREIFRYEATATDTRHTIMVTLSPYFDINLVKLPSWNVMARLQNQVQQSKFKQSLSHYISSHRYRLTEYRFRRLMVAMSPSGEYCAAPVLDDNLNFISIMLWDIVKREKIASYPILPYPNPNPDPADENSYRFSIPFCTFSPDGTRLAIWLENYAVIRVIDVKTGKLMCKSGSDSDANMITDLRFTPDNKSMLIAYNNGLIVAIDANTGVEQRRYGYRMVQVRQIAFTNDSQLLVALSSNLTHQWQLLSGHPNIMMGSNENHNSPYPHINAEAGISAEIGRNVLRNGNWITGTVAIRDLQTGQIRYELSGVSLIFDQAKLLSKDGRMIFTIKPEFNENNNPLVTYSLYNTQEGTLIKSWNISIQQGHFLTFSPDFCYYAFVPHGVKYNKLLIYDTFKDTLLPSPVLDIGGVVCKGTFNSDGSLMAIVYKTNINLLKISLWDIRRGQWKWQNTLKDKDINVSQLNSTSSILSFSNDDQILTYSGPGYDYITARNANTGEILWKSLTYGKIQDESHDSKFFAATDNQYSSNIKILQSTTGMRLPELFGHARVTCAAFNQDDSLVAIGYADGSVVLWDTKTCEKICHLLIFDDGTWAVIDPLGRYDASNAGDIDGLRWVIGDEIIALRQLKERYYEPGLLAKLLGYNDEPLRPVENLATVKLFPTMQITQPPTENAQMTINLTNRGGGIGAVRVLVNGKEFQADARGSKSDPRAATATCIVNLMESAALQRGRENLIEIIASNTDGTLSSRSKAFSYVAPGIANTRAPELYAIVVGISNYSSDKLKLRFAAKDADAMANALTIGSKRLFGVEKVHLTKLTTNNIGKPLPTKANLQQAFKNISNQAQTGDILVVYLAGHGAALSHGNDTYCYLTQEASDLDDVIDPVKREKVTITSEELRQWCTRIPALKQVMILDTCAAGAVAGTLIEKREISSDQIRAIERLKDRTGFHILMGCAGNARSYETTRYGQGLLTYSLLQGMKGAALREGQFVDINTLFSYAADQVPALAIGIGGLQRPIIAAPKGVSFDIGQLTADDRIKIPGAIAKPLLLRPVLLDINIIGDPLDLTDLLRKRLRNNDGNDWVCIDADTASDAISIQGTYTIVGDTLTINLKIWQADKELQKLTITGKKTGSATLIDSLITQLKPLLSLKTTKN